MQLLVTRPEPDASLSAERLRQLGYDVVVSPVLETLFSNDPLDWSKGTDITVTSRNGVRALSKLASDTMKTTARVFAVGDATATLAKEAGFQNVLSASGDVDDLVEVLSRGACNPLIYVCGAERRGNLEGRLGEQGYEVYVAERYNTVFADELSEPAETALKAQTIDGVLHYSRRSAEAFISLIEEKQLSYSTKKLAHFCLAKNILSVFDAEKQKQVIIADKPNEKSLFDVLAKFNDMSPNQS